jgi:hypothetical protein
MNDLSRLADLESLRGDSTTPAYEAHGDWKLTRLTLEL